MNTYEENRLIRDLSVLREVAKEYPSKTVENIIVQLEARLKEIGNSAEENKTKVI